MRFFLHLVAAIWAAGSALAQELPEASQTRIGPMPGEKAAQDAVFADMIAYSRDGCGIAVLLQLAPSAFPTDTYASPEALATAFGTLFAQRFSLSTRVYIVDRENGPATASAFVNGSFFARAREFQSFRLPRFVEMGADIAVANHSIKRMKRELSGELVQQNEKLFGLVQQRLQVARNMRDLAEAQLVAKGVAPEAVSLSVAARANPRTEVERLMVEYLDATADIATYEARVAEEADRLARSKVQVARYDCAFPAQDKLYGFDEIATLRPRIAEATGRPAADVTDAEIWRWIVETAFGTSEFEN